MTGRRGQREVPDSGWACTVLRRKNKSLCARSHMSYSLGKYVRVYATLSIMAMAALHSPVRVLGEIVPFSSVSIHVRLSCGCHGSAPAHTTIDTQQAVVRWSDRDISSGIVASHLRSDVYEL